MKRARRGQDLHGFLIRVKTPDGRTLDGVAFSPNLAAAKVRAEKVWTREGYAVVSVTKLPRAVAKRVRETGRISKKNPATLAIIGANPKRKRARRNSGSRYGLAYATARLHKALLYLRSMACGKDKAKADNARVCIADALGLISELMKGAQSNPGSARAVATIGRVLEVRYRRSVAPGKGQLYKHEYSTPMHLTALSDGSIHIWHPRVPAWERE